MLFAAYAGLIALGAALAVLLPRWAGFERPLRTAVICTYCARTLLALVVFWLSLAAPLTARVYGPGLWRVFPDTAVYHDVGIVQAEAARRKIVLSMPDGFSTLVGLAYSFLGVSPLLVMLMNTAVDVVSVVMLLMLARRLIGHSPPTWLAWGIGLWPSWMAWSTQLLKDSILTGLSIALLFVLTSVLQRASARSDLLRFGLLEWLLISALAVVTAMFRSAVTDVMTAAIAVVAISMFLRSIRDRAQWRVAITATVLLFAVLISQTYLRGKLHPVSASEVLRGYAELNAARALERGDMASAQARPIDNSVVGRKPNFPERLSIALSALRDAFKLYTVRLSLKRLSKLRGANMSGATQFADDADGTTVSGLLLLLPVGVAHTLFTPFPWSIFSAGGSTGALRSFAAIELPWIYAVTILGAYGVFVCRRLIVRRADMMLVVAYVTLGVLALAVAVPNDGLLFRYRLPFLAPLAIFVPAALQAWMSLKAR